MVKANASESLSRTGKERITQKRQKPKQESNFDQSHICDNTTSTCAAKNYLPDIEVDHDFSETVPMPVSKQSTKGCDSGPPADSVQTDTRFSNGSASVESVPSEGTEAETTPIIDCSYGTPVAGFLNVKNDIEVSFSQTSSDQDCELHEVVTDIISDLSNDNDSSKENHPSDGKDTNTPEVSSDVVCPETDTSPPSSVLEGVIAYVEVRTKFEDTSRSVEKQLLLLGAKVSKMNKKVTHIVFMNGRRSTQKKGISQGCHMVSVLWVEMCRQKKERVPEHLYPASLDDEVEDPLFPKKRKRFRCIQPKKFKDEFAASAERLKEIFSRVKMVSADSLQNPLTSTPTIAADNNEETKAKTSTDFLKETGTPFTQDKAPRPIVQKRKLFSNNAPSCSSVLPTADHKEKSVEMKFLDNELQNGTHRNISSNQEPTRENGISMKISNKNGDCKNREMVSEKMDMVDARKKLKSDCSNHVKEIQGTDNGNIINMTSSKEDTCPADDNTSSASNICKRKLNTQSQRKTVKQKGNNNKKLKKISTKENSTSHEEVKNKVVPSLTVSENGPGDKDSELHVKNCSSFNEKPNSQKNTSGHCDNAVRDNISNKKLPWDVELNSQRNVACPKLQDEGNLRKSSCVSPVKYTFSSGTLKKHVKSSVSPTKTNNNNVEKFKNVSHSSLDDFKDTENRHVTKKLKIATNTTNTVSSVMMKVSSKVKTPGRIVITNVPVNEEESLRSIIKSLGNFKVSETVTGSTTHVICGEKKRTLKVIFGIAFGCWLVSPQWVFKSLEAGLWLKEDTFELTEYYPAVQLSRMERYTKCSSYKKKLFQELGLIYISPCCNPPREKLTELVTMVGGKVTNSLKRCAVVVGTGETKINDARVVSEKWIFDCIISNEIIPITP